MRMRRNQDDHNYRVRFLEPPDCHYLEAAQGWLELGDPQSALDELELINPLMRAHPAVLAVQCEVCGAARKWNHVLTVATVLVQTAPIFLFGWVQRSAALHELKRTQEAFDLLLPANKKFPTVATVPYNLACYSAQLRRLKDARMWLHRAFAIGDAKELKLTALDDPDLEPLRNQIESLWS